MINSDGPLTNHTRTEVHTGQQQLLDTGKVTAGGDITLDAAGDIHDTADAIKPVATSPWMRKAHLHSKHSNGKNTAIVATRATTVRQKTMKGRDGHADAIPISTRWNNTV